MAVKVGIVSLGCAKNQVDAEKMAYMIKAGGFELCGDAALAEVVIVNTCGFIESAKQEAIETVLEFGKLKEEGRIKKIIVTGCLAERYREEIRKEIPEADAVVGIGSNSDICGIIKRVSDGETVESYGDKESLSLEGGRLVSTLPFFAYLKITEGCDNRCSYCAIPMIRGRYRSRKIEDILEEAKWLASHGVREINVIAQDTTRYGIDLYNKKMLPELLRELCKIEEFKWIRVLYCYPDELTDELLDVMASEEKIVKYIDLPIQHINSEVLKRMNRRGNRKQVEEAIEKIRTKIKDVTLRTTLITGFPGETEEQFTELAEFVKATEFDRLGCFPYSAEEGTPAAVLDDQLEEDIKQSRADHIMEVQMLISERHNQRMLGKTVEAVVEGFDRYAECYFGRTAADAPDIDGKIFFTSENKRMMGEFVKVHIDDVLDYDLVGTVVED